MSEEKKRIALDEESLEAVTGGVVEMVCTASERYVYGTRTPDVRYSFKSRSKVCNFVAENYSYYGEAGIFQALIAEGLIFPM